MDTNPRAASTMKEVTTKEAMIKSPMIKSPMIKSPMIKSPTTVEIVCVDCGIKRTINKGEAFQVKRCVVCQELHRKQLRREYRKGRTASLRERIKQLEGLLIKNNIEITT